MAIRKLWIQNFNDRIKIKKYRIENKLNNKDDILIFVKSNKKKILNRLKKRRNYNKKLIKNLNENQALISKKKKLANFVVDNDFHPNIMKKKIKFLKNKILDERNRIRYWDNRIIC